MNNARRKAIASESVRIELAIRQINLIKDNIERILSDEEDAFDNMPENLQYSERGENSQDAMDLLNEAISSLEDALDNLSDIN